MSNILIASKFLTSMSASILGGATIAEQLIEHPTRLAVETSVSTATFPISFRKASAFGLVLSSLGSVSSFYTYSEERDPKWLAVGLLFVGSLTYNYLALTPIYKKLSDPNLDKDSSDSESMIRLFGNLHSIKALIGFMSMVLVNMNLLKINTK